MTTNITYSPRALAILEKRRMPLVIPPSVEELKLIKESTYGQHKTYESFNATAQYQKGLPEKFRYNYVVLLNAPFISNAGIKLNFKGLSEFICSFARYYTGGTLQAPILYFRYANTRKVFLSNNDSDVYVLFADNAGEVRKWSVKRRKAYNKKKENLNDY